MNLLEELNKRLTEDSLETEVDTEGGYSIKLTLPGLGANGDKTAFIETSEIPMEEVEDYKYFYFFSILAVELPEEKHANILNALNNINLETLIGNFGLIAEEGVVYHKYVAKINVTDEAKAADDLYSALVDSLANVDNNIDVVINAIA